MTQQTTSRPARAVLVALPWSVAFVVVGPLLLGRGFWLFGDMVFTPHQPWKPEWYGGDGGVPRAVPGDALVSLATYAVPGDLVQKAVLFLLVGLAGWGVVRLLPGASPWSAAVACVFFQWNPYVLERLAIGQWALLCGYAALPWVAGGAVRVARGGLRQWHLLFVPTAVAAWTSPTGGALATLLGLGVVLVAAPAGTRVRQGAAVFLLAAVINLPWLVPGFLATSGGPADPAGAAAFAARADTPWGALGSLVTLGGIWKSSVVPLERESLALTTLALAVVCLAAAGVVLGARSASHRPLALGVAVTALPLLAFVWVSTTEAGQAASAWIITELPGGGLVRDSQKWLAPLALLLALGLGWAVEAVVRRVTAGPQRGSVAVVAAVAVVQVMTLPSLAWGNLGSWSLSTYPDEWTDVASLVSEESGSTAATTVVLPFGVYRRFEWNDQMAWLDPAPRIIPGRVLVDDTLSLDDDEYVEGESEAARRIRDAGAGWSELDPVLEDLGVRFVLVELGTPGQGPARAVPSSIDYTELHAGETLRLYDRGPQQSAQPRPGWAPWLLGGDVLLALAFLVALVRLLTQFVKVSRRGPSSAYTQSVLEHPWED